MLNQFDPIINLLRSKSYVLRLLAQRPCILGGHD